MKRHIAAAILIIAVFACSTVQSAPPIFKEKKYSGPIPFTSFSFGIGFLDGGDFTYLTDHLDNWAKQECGQKFGSDNFEALGLGRYGRVSYERQLTPNHFFKLTTSLAYLKTTSLGKNCARLPADTNTIFLNINRTFKVYLFSLDAGFSYYFVPPEVERFSPYAGAGFSAVVPMARLQTKSTHDGAPYDNPSENVSRNSFEAGMHLEFGMNYYVSNRYAFGLEGRYQMAHSKFFIHKGNFDLDYSAFTLSLNLVCLI